MIGLYGRAAARKPGLGGGIYGDGGSTSKFNRWQAALIHSGRNPKVSAAPAGTGEAIYGLKAKNKCFVIHAREAIKRRRRRKHARELGFVFPASEREVAFQRRQRRFEF